MFNIINIIKEALTPPNITQAEIAHLYHQRAQVSGQTFEANAVARTGYWSEGQP
jgi:hypothetical protein